MTGISDPYARFCRHFMQAVLADARLAAKAFTGSRASASVLERKIETLRARLVYASENRLPDTVINDIAAEIRTESRAHAFNRIAGHETLEPLIQNLENAGINVTCTASRGARASLLSKGFSSAFRDLLAKGRVTEEMRVDIFPMPMTRDSKESDIPCLLLTLSSQIKQILWTGYSSQPLKEEGGHKSLDKWIESLRADLDAGENVLYTRDMLRQVVGHYLSSSPKARLRANDRETLLGGGGPLAGKTPSLIHDIFYYGTKVRGIPAGTTLKGFLIAEGFAKPGDTDDQTKHITHKKDPVYTRENVTEAVRAHVIGTNGAENPTSQSGPIRFPCALNNSKRQWIAVWSAYKQGYVKDTDPDVTPWAYFIQEVADQARAELALLSSERSAEVA